MAPTFQAWYVQPTYMLKDVVATTKIIKGRCHAHATAELNT